MAEKQGKFFKKHNSFPRNGNFFKLLLLQIFVSVLLFLIVAAAYLALIRSTRYAITTIIAVFVVLMLIGFVPIILLCLKSSSR